MTERPEIPTPPPADPNPDATLPAEPAEPAAEHAPEQAADAAAGPAGEPAAEPGFAAPAPAYGAGYDAGYGSGFDPHYSAGYGYAGSSGYTGSTGYTASYGPAGESSGSAFGPVPPYPGGTPAGADAYGAPAYPGNPTYGTPSYPAAYGMPHGMSQGAPSGGPAPSPAGPAARPRRTVLVAAAVAAVVGAGVGAGTVAVVGDNGRPTSANLAFSTQAAPAAKVDGTVSAAADKIRPSVVTIEVTSNSERDTGSGVIIRADGYILTNNHVVSSAGNGARTIVTLSDGRRAEATVVGRDPSDDLAVVKIPLTGLTTATFASSASLQVGQTVVAVGAPLGLSDTVTAGIVSSTARPVQTGDSNSTATFNAVQTDAAINPGNSGGPLVNLNGDVVGINAAIATDQSQGGLQVPGQSSQSGNIGIGFAIPSDEASRIAGELITNGKATHAVMGVSVRDASSGGSATDPVGARVQTVTAGGPAADAGIKVGDVITQVDTQRIDGADAVVAAIRSHAPFQSVRITYLRGTESKTVTVRLDSATD